MTAEDFTAYQDQAAQMTTSCPVCQRGGRKVTAQFKQTTRQEPCKFLGFEGWCVDCQLGGLSVESAQMVITS